MTIDRIGQTDDLFGQISQSIRVAADQAGVNFDYLFQQAKIESGLNPDARARTSSATGLFQFTRDTWLRVVAQHGEAAGLSAESNALRSGMATAADRQRILDLRTNPDLSARLAAHHALDNARALAAQGINQSGPTELYLAHFLGSNGAAKFLNGMKSNPNAPAASLLPDAAQSNKTIFFKDGAPASFNDIYQRFSRKFDGAAAPAPTTLALAKSIIKTDIAKNNALSGDMLIARLKPQDQLLARQSPLKALPNLTKDSLNGSSKDMANGLADELSSETGFGQEPQNVDQANSETGKLSRLDPALVAGDTGFNLFDGYVIQTGGELAAPQLLSKGGAFYWQHIAYVVTWWFMCLLILSFPFYNRVKDRIK